jgi:LPXTG-motif cell wall-anchored protein
VEPPPTIPVFDGGSSAKPSLPATGEPIEAVVVWAFVLLVVGGGLFGARRRALNSNLTDKKS